MSFDFNLIGSFKPKVESTFLGKGGGGGNTGYFAQERKKQKDDENASVLSKFLNDDKLEKIAEEEMSADKQQDLGFMSRVKNILNKLNKE